MTIEAIVPITISLYKGDILKSLKCIDYLKAVVHLKKSLMEFYVSFI